MSHNAINFYSGNPANRYWPVYEYGDPVSQPVLKRITASPSLAALLLAGAVIAALAVLRAAGYLQFLELAGYDLLVTTTSGTQTGTPPIVLIGITESDIQAMGRWPLSDAQLAEVIEQIQAYRPRAIGVDIYRDQPVPPGREALNALLAARDNVIVIHKVGNAGVPAIAAPEVLQASDRTGFSDMVVDTGGVVRRGLLFLDDGQQVYYSFPLVLALGYLKAEGISPQPGTPDPAWLRLGDTTIPPFEANDGGYVDADAGGYQFLLDYRGGEIPFPRLSLAELQSGTGLEELIRDRIVILGVTAASVKDSFATPFSRQGPDDQGMPGIALHGHIAAQLLRMASGAEPPVRVVADSREYLWLAAWGVLGALLAVYVRTLSLFLLAIAGGSLLIVMLSWLAFSNHWWLPMTPPVLAWVLSAGVVLVFLRGMERSQRKLLMELFSRHVSQDVADEIWEQRDQFLEGGRLAASEVTATVLFSDLENFTPLSEKLGPVRLMEWLNRYMEIMAGLVMRHGGIVDDYYGDAIMADFGVPLVRTSDAEISQDARSAADCALAMRAQLERLNAECVQQGYPPVRMRVGICTGEMVAGFLGSAQRMKYTTIGDTVNTAARLESYGKELPEMEASEGACRILVGESTAMRLGSDYRVESVGRLELKGKAESVSVYKLMGKLQDGE
jgi:adenylate cyclase